MAVAANESAREVSLSMEDRGLLLFFPVTTLHAPSLSPMPVASSSLLPLASSLFVVGL